MFVLMNVHSGLKENLVAHGRGNPCEVGGRERITMGMMDLDVDSTPSCGLDRGHQRRRRLEVEARDDKRTPCRVRHLDHFLCQRVRASPPERSEWSLMEVRI